MTENELKHTVLRIAKEHGWLVFHMPQATIRGSQGKGYPDMTLCRDGIVMWFELKQADGRLTAQQNQWQGELPKGTAYVIRPKDVAWVEAVLA